MPVSVRPATRVARVSRAFFRVAECARIHRCHPEVHDAQPRTGNLRGLPNTPRPAGQIPPSLRSFTAAQGLLRSAGMKTGPPFYLRMTVRLLPKRPDAVGWAGRVWRAALPCASQTPEGDTSVRQVLAMAWDLQSLLSFENLAALATLTGLEIVLGVDNIVFIAIITGKLNPAVQARARQVGLLGAMAMRILLLLGIKWIMQLQATLFTVAGQPFSGKDLVLMAGGLFLLAKATYEIHHKLEDDPSALALRARRVLSFSAAVVQIMLIDLVFSLDSVITAVGMARRIEIMIVAIVSAVIVMMIFAGTISAFIERHPTLKMLALAFLLLIGIMLVAESLHQHISRGYIYFAMAFSLFVEILNIRASAAARARAAAVPPVQSGA